MGYICVICLCAGIFDDKKKINTIKSKEFGQHFTGLFIKTRFGYFW